MDSLITLDNAGLKADGRWLVRGVDLTISPGEIVTLIGPNGSGKSTTAKLALGIRRPSEGHARRRADLKVGYVPQKLSIDWTLPLTVDRLLKLTGRLSAKEVDDALARTGVGKLREAEVQNLSGGEFQRVLMARAIARRPNLLVLDEPVQGVDYTGEIALYEMIAEIRQELNCGVLLISHDLHIVMAATDRVVCLNGHVCCQGAPGAVSRSQAYRELFGPRASETLAIYEHHHDHTHLADGRVMHSDGTISDRCPGAGTSSAEPKEHRHAG